MSTTILRRVSLAVVLVAGVLAAPVTTAVAAPPRATVTFVAPTPAEGGTLTTDATSIAFTWDKKTNQTRSVSCALTGPTPSSSACSPPVSGPGGSASSGVSYSRLDNGSYTFTVNVTVNGGQTTTAVRHFTVAVPRTIIGLRADYWENSSGRYLGVQAYSTITVTNGNVTSWPDRQRSRDAPRRHDHDADQHGALRRLGRLRPAPPAAAPRRGGQRPDAGVGHVHVVRRLDRHDPGAPLAAGDAPRLHVAGYRTEFAARYLDPFEVRAELDVAGSAVPGT